MALVDLENITLAHGGPPLLDGVSLQVEPGDRICLLGRNGSGKSTLFKVLAGEVPPEGGEVRRRQGVTCAMVPQDIPPGISGSVFDVVAAGTPNAALLEEYHEVTLLLSGDGGGRHMERLESVQKKMDHAGAWEMHQEVERIIARLDLDPSADFTRLSGGTKRRVLLARALAAGSDILLLDEPTNHLDIDTIVWLEQFLLKNVRTLLFITHDRSFARRLSNRIGELDRGRLYTFACGYDEFIERREALLEAEIARAALFDKKLAEEEAWLRQGIKARRTRNEGRVRALLKMRTEREARRVRQGSAKIALQEGERSGRLVVEAENISFGWGNRKIIESFSTTVVRGDRIGVIGANGSGKTTLLRLLLGDLDPQGGTVSLGTRLQTLYFGQMREQLDPDKSVMENVGEGNDTITVNGRNRHIIGYLQDFLFTPERARTPVNVLSGGERNRLLLAKMFAKPSNLLVMDEPTNDLDIETVELLEELLIDYSGTLLLVSHDRDFLNNVVTSTIAMEGNGVVREYVGGYDDWLRQRPLPVSPEAPQPAAPKQRRQEAKQKKLSFKEERELDALPERIQALEEEAAEIHAKLSDPAFYKAAASEAAAVNARLQEVERELEVAFARWEELEGLKS